MTARARPSTEGAARYTRRDVPVAGSVQRGRASDSNERDRVAGAVSERAGRRFEPLLSLEESPLQVLEVDKFFPGSG